MLKDRIGQKESSGNYRAIGPTHPKYGRALGKFQVMEANVPEWTRLAFGNPKTADQFLNNPAIQDGVYDDQRKRNSSLSDQEFAAKWFTGKPNPTSNKRDVLGTSTQAYVQSTAGKMSVEDFGRKVQSKYPQYSNLDPAEIGRRTLEKYPQYSGLVNVATSTRTPDVGVEAKQPGLVQRFAQGMAHMPLGVGTQAFRLGRGLLNLGQAVGHKVIGNEEGYQRNIQEGINATEAKPVNFGYFGEVKPPETTREAIGAGLELASYAIAPPGLASAAKTGFKGLVKEGFKQGAKYGATGGAVAGAGVGLQQENASVGSVVGSTLAGGALGLGVGAVSPVIGRAVSRGKEAITGTRGEAGRRAMTQAVDELEDKYVDINRGWVNTRKASEKATRITEIKNKSGTIGKRPERVLAEHGIIPEHEGDAFTTKLQAQKLREETTILKNANRTALREAQLSTTPIPIDELERTAIQRARSAQNIAAGIADDLERGIRKQMDGYRTNYGATITLETLDDVKSARWGQTKFSLTRDDKLAGDIDYTIGKSAQETIEETAAKAGAMDVAQLNRDIGDILEAAKFLENLDGRKILYGRMGTHLARLTGAIIGSKGGPLGSLAGVMGGDLVARILRSAYIATPTKRAILRELQKTQPEAYKGTLKWLQKQGLDRELRLALPPGRGDIGPNQGRPIPMLLLKSGQKVDYVGKETVATNQSQGNLPSTKRLYTNQMTTAPNSASMLPTNVPQSKKKASNNLGITGQGAVDMLSLRKSGEITGAFSNPEIGNIDLMWGTVDGEGGGLSKIIKDHPEVVNQLDDILGRSNVVGGREGRIYMETPDGYRAVVRTDFDEKPKQWLLTAYKKKGGQGGRNRTSDESFQTTYDTTSPHPDKGIVADRDKKSNGLLGIKQNLENRAAFGGIAGIEKDEDGLGFNPQKAALGFAGLAALRRVGSKKGLLQGAKNSVSNILRGTKGLTADDIMKTHPNIKLTKDVPATDIYGNKVRIPDGEKLTPYELKGNKVLLQDGETYIVTKNQFANIKGQSVGGEAKPFAPELDELEETVKGTRKMAVRDKAYADFDAGTITREERNRIIDELGVPNETKYENYQLPGGKNYKEVLIKAPTNKELGKIPHSQATEAQKAEFAGFKSSHWDEPNVISHLRLNERTYNGKKVAFMEELQSDWAREGRSKGFATDITKDSAKQQGFSVYKAKSSTGGEAYFIDNTTDQYFHRKGFPNTGFSTEAEAWDSITKKLKETSDSIPNNPNLKNWTELSVKRALKDAVDSKAEYFSWINGEQTSARYNLATQVENVKWDKGYAGFPNKRIELVPKNKDAKTFLGLDDNGIIERSSHAEWNGKKLDEVLGKGLADSIMAKEAGNLSGEGLKFGGEWADNLYNKQVKNIVEDLTGGKVEVIDLKLPIDGKTENIIRRWEDTFNKNPLKPSELKIGLDLDIHDNRYIITDILGDGKFKAVPLEGNPGGDYMEIFSELSGKEKKHYIDQLAEEFDLSQKTTTQQAIRLTPEIKAKIRGEALEIKTSGKQFEDNKRTGLLPVALKRKREE